MKKFNCGLILAILIALFLWAAMSFCVICIVGCSTPPWNEQQQLMLKDENRTVPIILIE